MLERILQGKGIQRDWEVGGGGNLHTVGREDFLLELSDSLVRPACLE